MVHRRLNLDIPGFSATRIHANDTHEVQFPSTVPFGRVLKATVCKRHLIPLSTIA